MFIPFCKGKKENITILPHFLSKIILNISIKPNSINEVGNAK